MIGTSYRPPPPAGFEGAGPGTVPTGEAWTLTAPYYLGTPQYPHIFVGNSPALNNAYSDNGGGSTSVGSIVVADDQSWIYYLFGYGPNWTLNKWSLTYPTDWSRTTFQGSITFNFAGSASHMEIYVDPTQTHLYILDGPAERIHQYATAPGPLVANYVRSWNIVGPYSGQPTTYALNYNTPPRPKYTTFSLNSTGTKLFIWSRQILRLLSYTLTIPFNLSSAIPDWYDNIPFLSADGLANGFTGGVGPISGVSDVRYKAVQWSGDGHNLYLLGDSTYRILQFYCSDPWNLSSATLIGSVSYSSQGSANDMYLNDYIGSPRIVLAHGNKLSLWAFGSGMSISSLYFVRSWQPRYPNAATSPVVTVNAITFGNVTEWLYVLSGSRVIQYEIPNGMWDLGNNQYVIGNKVLGSGVSMQFRPNGHELYIMTTSGLILSHPVNSSWQISSAVYGSPNNRRLGQVCDVTGTTEFSSALSGFFIRSDGEMIFTCSEASSTFFDTATKGMRVYKYLLGSSFNFNAVSINSRFGPGYFSLQDTTPVKVKVSNPANKVIGMYRGDNPSTVSLRFFNINTPGDLSTAVYSPYTSSGAFGSFYNANFHLNTAGNLLYGLNQSGTITKLNLPTAYIMTGITMSFRPLTYSTRQGPSFLRYTNVYNNFARMKPDGTKIFQFRTSGTNPAVTGLVETQLGSAYDFNLRISPDIGKSVEPSDNAARVDTPGGLYIRSDGIKLWIYRATSRRIQEWQMTTAWDISTASVVKTWTAPHSTGRGLHWTPDGQRLFMGTTDRILSAYCTTPWDIATAIYEDGYYFYTGTDLRDFYMDNSGSKIFAVFNGTQNYYVTGGSVATVSALVREYSMVNFNLGTASLVRTYRISNRLIGAHAAITSVYVTDDGYMMMLGYRNMNFTTDTPVDYLLYKIA